MRKTIHTHPFLVKAELPKGHGFGLKKRISIRNSRFRTEAEAICEYEALIKTGVQIVLIYNKKVLIKKSV